MCRDDVGTASQMGNETAFKTTERFCGPNVKQYGEFKDRDSTNNTVEMRRTKITRSNHGRYPSETTILGAFRKT